MDSQSSKPSSSRRDRYRDRERKKSRDKDRDNYRSRNRDRDHDRGRNRHDRPRSTSPAEPSSKRQRTSASRKGKEPVRNGDRELGEVEVKVSEIGDDFIPLGVSDNEATPSEEKRRSEKTRQEEKGAEREWDRGKTTRQDRDEESPGTKRKYELVFDEEDDWAYRRSQRYERPVARMAPWVSQVDWDSCRNVGEMLHREVEAFVKYMSPTPVEDEIRGLVIQLVSNAITSAFPDARILPFGSYETKLYLPSGDIDLVIDSDSMAYSNKVNVLHALANTLKRAGITSKVSVISRAKVPIVKFVTHFGRLNVDISVNQGNGVAAGQIINGFLNDMPGCGFALRSLVIIAKAFLSQRGMNEVFSGGLGSYSIVCLAVNFLQMHPKIRRGEIEAEKNLGVLVMEFFELYGCYFNYEEVGVSIRNGGSYFNKRQRGWYDSMKNHLLSIEDPTDPANDISKGSYGINKVRQTLAGAYGIMQAAAFLRAGILSSRREGHSYPLRKGTNPEDMSILSSILGVTQETINNRRLLQEVYDKGSLHQFLGNGVAAGQIINGFLNDMPGCGFALRSLVIIAKAFLSQRGMNEVFSGGLGSYSIVCLAVNFLQMHPKIRRGEIEAEKNLGVLVMEFFELYGCYFNYEEVGVSIRNGGSYFNKRQRGWYDSMKNHLLSIEDPTDPANDISKGSYGINKVRQTLAGAYGIMQAAAFLRAGILSSRREGHSYPLRKGTNPEDMSILSSILGVTQETINNRRLLQEVYDKGSLHQFLGVSPKASVVTVNVPDNHQIKGDSLVGASSVQEAWDGADQTLDSDDDHRNGITKQEDPEDTSRYHIQERQTSQGRSNGESRFSALATYTTDEDDDEEELSEDELEHQAYDIESDADDRKSRMSRRRSYWLSKASGHGETLGEDDEESS
ncbi:hypothetical protein PAXINDRAFT_102356 [Paxillus involutus ATCC 200175]|uniref:polynucleotide adenylyltransferase n=1 Tax=Paxillus involutus ATCC 200175 TaxID=664439 RepID=A0A0C9SPK8_PAXIN|nr:hypothetical protein PAXINDRAFT_102356 [Paxillus involutus ATCC 200175]